MEETKLLLEKLCMTPGVSGYESPVAQFIKDEFNKYCDDVKIDTLGNIIGLKKGKSKGSIMIAGHMDEIGLMVSNIEDGGFVRFTTIGGYDFRTLVSQEVVIHGKKDIYGVIGIKPPHLTGADSRNKTIPVDEMAIDTGYSKEELEKYIRIGNIITIKSKATRLLNDQISAKAMDDRTAIATMIETMKDLQNFNHDVDVYFVATVQEEVGLKGAITSTYQVKPDIGIAIDVTFGDQPGVSEFNRVELGGGPSLDIGNNVHPKVYELLKDTANKYNIPYQIQVHSGHSGTDLYAMQIVDEGLAGGLIGIPLRYMHTSVEVVDVKDIVKASQLLSQTILELNNREMEEILCF